MKRSLAFLLVLALLAGLAGCGLLGGGTEQTEPTTETTAASSATTRQPEESSQTTASTEPVTESTATTTAASTKDSGTSTAATKKQTTTTKKPTTTTKAASATTAGSPSSGDSTVVAAIKKKNPALCSSDWDKKVAAKAISIIKSEIKSGMSTAEKIAAIHNYIILHARYDSANFAANTIPPESYAAYGVLCLGVGVCESFAEAFYIMMSALDIDCKIVVSVPAERHAWNKVKIDGVWYNIDLTWDDPSDASEVSYRYYLVSDTANTGHTPNSSGNYPASPKTYGLSDAGIYTTPPGMKTLTGFNNLDFKGLVVKGWVKSIGNNAFSGRTKLQSVVLESGVEKIEDCAFFGATALKSITLPDTLTEIGASAFGDSGLTSIVLPKSLKKIGSHAFSSCTKLESVSLPPGVSTDGVVFWGLSPKLTLILQDGWKRIDSTPPIEGVKTIDIPDSVTYIGEYKLPFAYWGTETVICSKGSAAEQYALAAGLKVKYR